jgi:hypothetical protein
VEEGATVVFLQAKGTGEVFEGDGVVSKLKKTKDVIDAKVGGARHGKTPFWERRGSAAILCTFLKFLKPFSGWKSHTRRPTHDRLAALRQADRHSSKEE